jgi:hypothetical protein
LLPFIPITKNVNLDFLGALLREPLWGPGFSNGVSFLPYKLEFNSGGGGASSPSHYTPLLSSFSAAKVM